VAPRGPNAFGWDPVFQPKDFDETFAEMDKAVKNEISHRYKSLAKLKDFFLNTESAKKPADVQISRSPVKTSQPIKFITGNANKLKEVNQIMGTDFPLKIEIEDIDLPEFQGTPNQVATTKCKEAFKHIQGPVLVEDTSLCFNAVKGMPGPYIKWFLKGCGPEGLHKMLDGFEDKSAYALCTFAYHSGEKDAKVRLFEGRCDGTIVAPRGPNAFGWDPVFQPKDFDETFAEMDKAVKNEISHRYKSLAKLKDFFLNGESEDSEVEDKDKEDSTEKQSSNHTDNPRKRRSVGTDDDAASKKVRRNK